MTNAPAHTSARARAALCLLLLLSSVPAFAAGPRRQADRLDLRMRSFAPPASGRVTVEASEGGGRGRVTALSLPDPQTVAPGAQTYVVWAVGEGRIALLGELRRDERGNGGLAFERPEAFERYSVVVTAEPGPAPERPGSPVLSTRAGEVTTLYPALVSNQPPTPSPTPSTPAEQPTPAETPTPAEAPTPAATPRPTPDDATPARPTSDPQPPAPRRRDTFRRVAGPGFYGEVDDALAAQGGGRLIDLEGEQFAPEARGEARAAQRAGLAYVRADFQNVPLPSAVGAQVYILWGILPDGRIVYMGSLPVGEALNVAEIYVRTPGFDSDDFTLFVTAERQRPAPSPSGRRVLSPKTARLIVK